MHGSSLTNKGKLSVHGSSSTNKGKLSVHGSSLTNICYVRNTVHISMTVNSWHIPCRDYPVNMNKT